MGTDTKEEVKQEFKVGDYVRAVEASQGWGNVSKGDIGKIISMSPEKIIVAFPNDNHWYANKEDLVLVDDVEFLQAAMASVTHKEAREYVTWVNSKESRYTCELSKVQKKYDRHASILAELDRLKAMLTTSIRSEKARNSKVNATDVALKMEAVMNKYASIEFLGNGLLAKTKSIVVPFTDEKGKVWEVGFPELVVEITLDAVKVHNYVTVVGTLEHPHVSFTIPCLGSYANVITKSLIDSDYLDTLLIMHDFLSSCNQSGWYKDVRYWLKDAEKRCHDCWKVLKECTCKRCSSCGERIVDCDCARCPETSRLITDTYKEKYCTQCSDYDEDEERCDA